MGILHVCGGDPSPVLQWALIVAVFSTYVEVILTLMSNVVQLMSILHVCGGDPKELNNS